MLSSPHVKSQYSAKRLEPFFEPLLAQPFGRSELASPTSRGSARSAPDSCSSPSKSTSGDSSEVQHRRELGHRDGHRGTDAAQRSREPPTAVAPASRRRRIWSYELHERVVGELLDRAGLPRLAQHLGQRFGTQPRAQERQQVVRGHSREVTISDFVGSRHELNIG